MKQHYYLVAYGALQRCVKALNESEAINKAFSQVNAKYVSILDLGTKEIVSQKKMIENREKIRELHKEKKELLYRSKM